MATYGSRRTHTQVNLPVYSPLRLSLSLSLSLPATLSWQFAAANQSEILRCVALTTATTAQINVCHNCISLISNLANCWQSNNNITEREREVATNHGNNNNKNTMCDNNAKAAHIKRRLTT